jgi:hypothetical protein
MIMMSFYDNEHRNFVKTFVQLFQFGLYFSNLTQVSNSIFDLCFKKHYKNTFRKINIRSL